jgi:hypothetical protein
MMKSTWLIVLFATFWIVGCAADSVRVGSPAPDGYGPNELSTPVEGMKIAVPEFKQSTGKPPNTIGEAKTGAFNSLTPIVSEEPANVIVRNSIKKGLEGIGLQVVEKADADYLVDGTVERLWVDEHATGLSLEYAKAHVKYDIYVRNGRGETVWANTIEGFKTSHKSADATRDDIPTLTIATEESVRSFVEDTGFWKAISR